MSDDHALNPITGKPPTTTRVEVVREVDWSFNGGKPLCYGGPKITPYDITTPENREYLLRQYSRHLAIRGMDREEVDAAAAIAARLLYAADLIVEVCPPNSPSTQAALAKLHEALAMAHLALAQR